MVKDNIKGTFDDPFEGIEIQDLVRSEHFLFKFSNLFQRQLILKEESEHYEIFSQNERDELLFLIFKALVLGGSLCQYENQLTPYLDVTRIFYKTLVRFKKKLKKNFMRFFFVNSAKKDAASNSVFIEGYAYEIEEIGKNRVKEKDHPQNFVYVTVSPGGRTVHVLANRWEKYW